MPRKKLRGRRLGVDYGSARVGLALTDPGGVIAEPLMTIPGYSSIVEILRVAGERVVVEIIVGMPLNMDGSRSEQTLKTLEFVEELRSTTDLPVVTWDERLSTVEAERVQRGGGRGRKRGKSQTDATAAAIILRSYLDSLG